MAREATETPVPRSAETSRLYEADWRGFVAWCREQGLSALPALPATVATYLATNPRLSHGALARRHAAILDRHRRTGLDPPIKDAATAALLRQTRRDARPRQRPAPGTAQLRRMAAACPSDRAGLRDRALLLLAATLAEADDVPPMRGLLARLLHLDFERVRFTAAGCVLGLPTIPGAVADMRVPRAGADPRACPVRALEEWLRASDTRFGPVFRKIDRWGNIEHRRLGADAARRIQLARRVRHRGLAARVDR